MIAQQATIHASSLTMNLLRRPPPGARGRCAEISPMRPTRHARRIEYDYEPETAPQAMRAPEFPEGSVRLSSAVA